MIYIYIWYINIYNIHPNRIISSTSTLTTPLAPLDTAVLHPQCYQWSNKPRHQGKTTGDQNGFIWIAGRFSPKFIPSAGISGLPWITEVAAWILQICWVKTPPFRPKWLAFMDDLWMIYGLYLDDLWMIFGWFLDDFWMIFGWFMSSSPKMMCISQDPVPSPECVTPAAHPRHLRRRAEWTERPTGTWGYPDNRHFCPEKIWENMGKLWLTTGPRSRTTPFSANPQNSNGTYSIRPGPYSCFTVHVWGPVTGMNLDGSEVNWRTCDLRCLHFGFAFVFVCWALDLCKEGQVGIVAVQCCILQVKLNCPSKQRSVWCLLMIVWTVYNHKGTRMLQQLSMSNAFQASCLPSK